eukprot:Hpha_TRINITY_DN16393_c2_g4::TRINITY_DN16393_c2_g4_i1::g.60107::m.60107
MGVSVAACTIQRCWRVHHARRTLRGRRVERQVQREGEWQAQLCIEASIIQRAHRRSAARRELRRRRGVRDAEVNATREAEREEAVLVLQRAARCMIARKRVEAERVRQRKELHLESATLEQQCADDAAATVQSLWRGHRDRERVAHIRDQLSPPLSQGTAAIRIQCMARSTVARRRVREQLEQRHASWSMCTRKEAATIIQSHSRKTRQRTNMQRMVAARREEWKCLRHDEGARCIQSAVRGRSARGRARNLRQDRARVWEATRASSALWIAVEQGRLCSTHNVATQMAEAVEVNAALSQSRFVEGAPLNLGLCTLTLALADRSSKDALESLSVLLQSSTRTAQHADAFVTLTQAFARTRVARALVHRRIIRATLPPSPPRQRLEEEALTPGRGLELLLLQKAHGLPLTNMVVQTMHRHQLERRTQIPGVERQEAAARVLQAHLPDLAQRRVKRHEAVALRREREAERGAMKRTLQAEEAALCIQLWCKTSRALRRTQVKAAERSDIRNQEVMVMLKVEREMQHDAACTLQRLQRCRAAKAQTGHLRWERDTAIRLQLEAEHVLIQVLRNESATNIQVWYRGRMFMAAARQRRLELKAQRILFETAVAIQAGARGMLTRSRLKEDRRRGAALGMLQHAGRGWQGRGEAYALRRGRRAQRAATRIQAQVRGMLGRVEAGRREAAEHARVLRERVDIAVCFIQRAERVRVARRELVRRQSVAQEAQYAATMVSRVVRGHLARQNEVAERRRLRAVRLQHLAIHAAITELQRIFRGCICCRALASQRARVHGAARDLQRVERGRVGRRQARVKRNAAAGELSGCRREAAAAIIQGAWRQAMAKVELRRRRYRRGEASRTSRWQTRMLTRIQCGGRGQRARVQLRLRHVHARRACIIIQRVWRGVIARTATGPELRARRQVRAARKLQRVWRRLRPRLEQKADERGMLRGLARMRRSELMRQEKGTRMGVALGYDEGLASIRDTFRKNLADMAAPEALYHRFVAAIPPRRARRAATRVQKGFRLWKARVRVDRLRRQRDARITREKGEERQRAQEEEAANFRSALERGKRRGLPPKGLSNEFTGFSTAPERHQEWTDLFEGRRVRLGGPLHMLLAKESSERGGMELAFTIQSEAIAAPFRAPPPLSQGWRSRGRQPPPPPTSRLLPPLSMSAGANGEPLEGSVDTIALRLGSSIHNTRRANVDTAFGSPRAEPPQPRRLVSSHALSPLVFKSADARGAVKAVAVNRGSVEALRRLVCLDDPAVTVADVSGLGIMSESVVPLLSGLRANSHVRVLDLSRNPLGDECAEAVAQLLRMNSSITAVDLSGTQITDVGASHLAATVAGGGNVSVQRLNLESTLTSNTQRARIASALMLRSLPAPSLPVGAGGAGARHLKRRPLRRLAGPGGGLCADIGSIASRPGAEAIARDAAAVHFGGGKMLKTI